MKTKNYIAIAIFVILLTGPLLYRAYFKEGKKMEDLRDYTIEEVKKYAEENNLSLETNKVYSNEEENKIIYQSIREGSVIDKGQKLIIKVSIGNLSNSQLRDNKVNELGKIPVMMYHEIVNMRSDDTGYTGGNVDINGYNRTTEAFIQDLEFYYQNGYRMIKLEDYINGNIDTELGKSPIILTFDDGNQNNINILEITEDKELVIDPNSAVGILENFKKKYPDYNVTATFFINGTLFNQPEYDEEIIKWLVEHNYSIGNHTYNHTDLEDSSENKVKDEINKMYDKLNKIIPEDYLNIIALPYGNPTSKSHDNFKYILDTGKYKTVSILRVGWEPEYSPFNKNHDSEYIKRCRAWDNNGKVFDIEMNFKILNSTKYISDGNENTIVYPKELETELKNINNLKTIKY